MSDRPNILFLFSDQHAAHALGCYGNTEVRTPHLDRLAAEGVLFENAFAQCGICAPSRMSVYTGCYPATLGARGNLCQYPDHLPPLLPHFKEAGYRTAAIGKMHFVPGRRCPGFDLVRLTRGGTDALPDDDWREWLIDQDPAYEQRWPYGKHLDCFDGHPDFERNRHMLNCELPLEHYVDTWVANEAVQYIENHDGQDPFFLWVGFTRPHDPYAPPEPYDSMYDSSSLTLWPKPWGSFRQNSARHEHWVRYRIDEFEPPFHQDHESWLRDAVAAFYGQVSVVDDGVGRVLDCLKKQGLDDNTIIVYATDHGDFVGRYGMMGKLIAGNDSLIRVPLIWHAPWIDGGQRHSGLVENLDIFPTLFDIAGMDVPEQCEGKSLRPALEGDASLGKETVYFQDEASDGLRTREWTYVRRTSGERELYNLADDPYQEANLLLDDPDHPKAAELDTALSAALERMSKHGS